MRTLRQQNQALREELAAIKTRLEEAENTLRAVCSGETDAILVDTSDGERLFMLKGAEQPYREMVETMSEGAVTVTSAGVILYSNQRFAEMTKVDLQTVIGRNLLAFCSPENIAEVSSAFQESWSGDPRIRATLLANDATLVPVNMAMRGQSRHGSDSIAIVITDLTKWQQAEQMRERAIRALRITNACSDVIIHATDETVMLTEACQAMVTVGGYKSAWIGYTGCAPAEPFCPVARAAASGQQNKNLGVIWAGTEPDLDPIGAIICPRHVCALRAGDGNELQGCVARDVGHRPRINVPLLADGEFFGCWVLCSDEPGAFSRDEVSLLATVASDLAFGLAAQRNKRARSRLAAIVESAGDAIAGRDLDGSITSWNSAAEQLLGYRAEEIIGRRLGILCPPEVDGESDLLFAKIQCGETVKDYDTVRLSKDGRRLPVSLTYSPVRDDAGGIVGAAIFLRDYSARKAAEETLRLEKAQSDLLAQNLAIARDQAVEANQAKSRFLATVTHELRTPLHGILGYAELLILEGGLNTAQLGRLEAMVTAGHGLLDTINAVLDMSQIEANRLQLWPVEFELSELIATCLDVIRPAAEAKGLTLKLPHATPCRVVADRGRLRQVLINLLGNAVKFTPAGSVELRVRQAEGENFIRFEVADTGPGVRAKHRDKLFNTFERLNAEAMSGIEGSGLGLAIAARLMQLMGGHIGYDDNPGGGAVFWVELPQGSLPAADIKVGAKIPATDTRRLRILVVDDEAMNRDIARGFLGSAGHQVVCVDSGPAALDAASTEDFDVILMDVRMPGLNGLEATRLIRALPPPRCDVRVVAVTAQAFAEQIEICRRAGMDGHVAKPFKQAELLAALGNTAPERSVMKPAAPPPPETQENLPPSAPILDRAAFDEIAESLSAADMAENLQILITRCEAMLDGLRLPGMLSKCADLAQIAHKIAGGAGTFGFLHVAAAARCFEHAADNSAAETLALGHQLAAAIEASITVIRQEIHAIVAVQE